MPTQSFKLSKKANQVFNNYVGEAVNYYKRKKGWTNEDLSVQINLTESFIKKANTGSRHYNAYHIWQIAQLLNVPISHFYPPLKNDADGLKQYQEIYPLAKKDDFERFLHLLIKDL